LIFVRDGEAPLSHARQAQVQDCSSKDGQAPSELKQRIGS
jgi:hypothetical protein